MVAAGALAGCVALAAWTRSSASSKGGRFNLFKSAIKGNEGRSGYPNALKQCILPPVCLKSHIIGLTHASHLYNATDMLFLCAGASIGSTYVSVGCCNVFRATNGVEQVISASRWQARPMAQAEAPFRLFRHESSTTLWNPCSRRTAARCAKHKMVSGSFHDLGSLD